jgi:heme-degrading monooxygenase HmoA
MYLHMSIHKPHPEATDALVDSMRRFGEALQTQPGLIDVRTFQTPNGELIGLALWESEDAWERGRLAGGAAVKDDPFHEWEAAPVIGFRGESLT